MLVSDAIQNFLKEHDLEHLIPEVEKMGLEAIRYVPKTNCGFTKEEYFKGQQLSETEMAIGYGLYRMKLDKLHKR